MLVGPNAPRVRLITPASKKSAASGDDDDDDDDVTVRWKAFDPDNDPLTARLDYAADGKNFRTVVAGLTSDRWKIPADLLMRSSHARLRVVVSDGYHETVVTSVPLATAGPVATLRIVSPASVAWSKKMRTDKMSLIAQFIDLNGRQIPRSEYRWFIDGRRGSASGGVCATAFVPSRGRHIVKVSAKGRATRWQSDALVLIVH